MADAKIYRCKHCGNIVVKIVDGGPTPVCCGEPMEELVANTTDAAVEKHVPALTVEGDRLVAHVGSVGTRLRALHRVAALCRRHQDRHPLPQGRARPRGTLPPGRGCRQGQFTPTATSMASGRLELWVKRTSTALRFVAALAVPGRHASLWVVRASLAGIQSIAGYER